MDLCFIQRKKTFLTPCLCLATTLFILLIFTAKCLKSCPFLLFWLLHFHCRFDSLQKGFFPYLSPLKVSLQQLLIIFILLNSKVTSPSSSLLTNPSFLKHSFLLPCRTLHSQVPWDLLLVSTVFSPYTLKMDSWFLPSELFLLCSSPSQSAAPPVV